ncbi:hypothetical protein V2O64_16260 [Verrucomicrobiaceae bacterium 227]
MIYKLTTSVVATLMATLSLVRPASATETENLDFQILPAPGKMVIDGRANDWDLSGSIFNCSDVENYRDQLAAWQSAQFDADNLYLLTRWVDMTPMNNPGLCGSDQGFEGDCLQVRIITGSSGAPDVKAEDATTGQKTTHITAWSGSDGRDIIDLVYGKKFDEGAVKDAKKEGGRQAFVKDADGNGYLQEIAIPWKLLTRDGAAPKAGDAIIMTFESNFGTSSKMRITTKDLFRPGVTPDRVFAFMSSSCWGLAKLQDSGGMTPPAVRLADERTFAVTLENGVPVVNWKGLYKEEKTEGFAKIALQMPEDGFVSLIVKNADGQVVRNLVNAQFMTEGAHEVLWDGLTTPSDRKPGDPVVAGDYTWEALWRKEIGLDLVGWASNAGKAPFDSPGGNWGGDMGVPCAVDSDAESVYLGWQFAEAGQALVCTDFDGNVKWRHKRGGFGGAQLIAIDQGLAYVYDAGQGNMIYRLDTRSGVYSNWQGTEEATLELGKILAPFKPGNAGDKEKPMASGMAAINGKIFVSYGSLNASSRQDQASGDRLLVLDGATGKLLNTIETEDPGDLKLGADGQLYLLSGSSKVATVDPDTGDLTMVVEGLENAGSCAADKDGNIYVGLADPENQVKVFDKAGKFVRAIGRAGGRPLVGPWDKTGLRFIAGIKVDANGKLWVTECDDTPKRISVWDAGTGTFEKEMFGPTAYGAGGGAICPTDIYTMIGHGCEWKIAEETGRAECVAVITRAKWKNARFGTGQDGRVYAAIGDQWLEGRSKVSIFERITAGHWKLRTLIWADGDRKSRSEAVNIWSDQNDDQEQQPGEIRHYDLDLGGWIDGWYLYFNQAMTFAGGTYRIDVTGWTPCGAPEYDLTKAVRLPVPVDIDSRGGMGTQKSLVSQDGNYAIFNGHYGAEHSDFLCYDIRTGRKVFAYPNNYVGVHGGHRAPPAKTGLIRGAYDIVGTVKMAPPLENLFVIGTDKGEWHLLSSSGYYLASLFEGDPMKIKWPDEAVPGTDMSTVPPGMGTEDFGGSVIMGGDGHMYVQAGKTAFINCKVTGLDTVKSLGSGPLKITPEDRVIAQQFKVKYLNVSEVAKQIDVKKSAITFTGDPRNDFGVEPFIFGTDPNKIQSWLAHDDENLYVAWRVNDKTPWVNGATGFENLYASGDTVDLQLGVDPNADPERNEAVKGDLRLSIGRLQGQDTAVLYRKVSDEQNPRTFYSGTSKGGYSMEFVAKLAGVRIESKPVGDHAYLVQAAIPLKQLGVRLEPGLKLRGDLGATFSDPVGKDTTLRVFWSNQATGIVADEVEELKMQPAMWGELSFE